MGAVIVGGTSGVGADVDANKNLKVVCPAVPAQAGYVKIAAGATNEPLDVTENGYLKASLDSMIFYDQVDGANINTNLWTWVVTGAMAAAQTGGFITLNSGAITTLSTNVILTSVKTIPVYADKPLRTMFNAKVVNLPITNAQAEIGLGAAVAGGTPTDGAFFRWTVANQFVAVINNNGTEITSANLTGVFTGADGDTVTMPPAANTCYIFEIVVVEDLVQFFVDDILVASLVVATANAYPFNNGRQTVFARVINSGSAPSSAPQLSIGQVEIDQHDLNQNKLWKETLVSLGRGAYQSPLTAFGQTANHAIGASPTSATLNSAVASYTTLGGRYQLAAVAGAATDFPLFGFQVPVGYQFICTGVQISCANTGAAVGASGTVLDWSVGVNSSNVNLATADAVGPPQTWAPRKIPVGVQGFPTAAAIGAVANNIQAIFDPPIITDGGRFFHIILQIPVGLATASEIFRGDVLVTGYFE